MSVPSVRTPRAAKSSPAALDRLLKSVRACDHCRELPLGPRPVVHIGAAARVLIIGQAPGRKVHDTGISWNDASGKRLRDWLGVDRETFYDENRFGIFAMAFCYPGRDPRGGDLPPPPDCAPLWHARLIAQMPEARLTLLIGRYSQRYYLGADSGESLSSLVRNWRVLLNGGRFPLPHPSPRNTAWFQRHPWFEAEVVPALREAVGEALTAP